MLTKAHQLDVVAKKFNYCFKTIKLETGNLRGEFYKFSDGTPNVMLVLYNFKNVNNLNLEKHFKFPTQLQKVLRSFPEIKKHIQKKFLTKDAIQHAKQLVKDWNKVKNMWIQKYLKGNRRTLRDWSQLQNELKKSQSQRVGTPDGNSPIGENKVHNEEPDDLDRIPKDEGISKEKSLENECKRLENGSNNKNAFKRKTVDSVEADSPKKKERQEESEGRNTNADAPEELVKEKTQQSEAIRKQLNVDCRKQQDLEKLQESSFHASEPKDENIGQNRSHSAEDIQVTNAKSGEKSEKTEIRIKSRITFMIPRKPPTSKPEVLPKALQIKAIAEELGYTFDITWGENFKQRGEFYKETTGKPGEMLIFYNFIRHVARHKYRGLHGKVTLQRFFKFPKTRQKLLTSYPEIHKRVQSQELAPDTLDKAKALDEAWKEVMKIWRKKHQPFGLEIIGRIGQIKPWKMTLQVIQDPEQAVATESADVDVNDILEKVKEDTLPCPLTPLPPTPSYHKNESDDEEEESSQAAHQQSDNVMVDDEMDESDAFTRALQIQKIAIESGFIFDITWGENLNPIGEFYPFIREGEELDDGKNPFNGKPKAMLVFQNLVTLQKFYKFPYSSQRNRLFPTYSEVQKAVGREVLPLYTLKRVLRWKKEGKIIPYFTHHELYTLDEVKDLDDAWSHMIKIWRKKHPSGDKMPMAIREKGTSLCSAPSDVQETAVLESSSNDVKPEVCKTPNRTTQIDIDKHTSGITNKENHEVECTTNFHHELAKQGKEGLPKTNEPPPSTASEIEINSLLKDCGTNIDPDMDQQDELWEQLEKSRLSSEVAIQNMTK